MIKKYKKNIKIKYINSEIMNQLSYHVENKKLKNLGLNLKSNIQKDIKQTLKLFNYLK
jgi:ferritin